MEALLLNGSKDKLSTTKFYGITARFLNWTPSKLQKILNTAHTNVFAEDIKLPLQLTDLYQPDASL